VKQCKEKLVTTDTNEQVITGRKIISKELLKRSSELDVSTKVSQDTYNTAVRFRDKNNKETGAVNNYQTPNGVFRTVLEARNKDNYVPRIGVAAPFEGTSGGWGYALETPAGAPDNAIITKSTYCNSTAWMPLKIVAEDGNQQVTPTGKSVLGGIGLLKNKTFSKGDGFTSWVIGERKTTGETTTALVVRRFLDTDETEIVAGVGVGVAPDGTMFGFAPTVPTNNNDSVIATTNYVNNKLQVVSVLPASPDPNVFYFIPE